VGIAIYVIQKTKKDQDLEDARRRGLKKEKKT
jgi:hypothetical protein